MKRHIVDYRNRIIFIVIVIVIWVGILLIFPNIPEPAELDQQSSINNIGLTANALTTDDQLPLKVEVAIKNKVQIFGKFTRYGRIINYAYGTGYIFSDNIVLSARHVLLANIINMQRMLLLPFDIDQYNVPVGREFDYEYFSRKLGDSDQLHQSKVIALGEWNTLQDMMALDVDSFSNYNDPKFATSLTLGEKIYVSGYSPYSHYIPMTNGTYRNTAVDLIEYTYTDQLSAIINDDNLQRNGLNMLLRLRGNVNKGFSGGVAFNKDGEVVGMAVTVTDNFVYLISAMDVQLFLNKVRSQFK